MTSFEKTMSGFGLVMKNRILHELNPKKIDKKIIVKQKSLKKRQLDVIKINGEVGTVISFCKKYDIPFGTYRSRVASGLDEYTALTKPRRKMKSV